MKRALLVVLVTVVVIVLLGRIYFTRPGQAPSDQPPLVEIKGQGLAALEEEFNRASNSLRVILLLSPT